MTEPTSKGLYILGTIAIVLVCLAVFAIVSALTVNQ